MAFALIVFSLWWFTNWLPGKLVTRKRAPTFLAVVFLLNLLVTMFIGFWGIGLLEVANGGENSFGVAVAGAFAGFTLALIGGGWSLFRAIRKAA